MSRLLAIVFGALVAISAVMIVATSAQLPMRVASHFAGDGSANGWQTRDAYVVLMLAFGVVMPCFVAAAIAWLPRRFPRLVNLPQKDYWLAPQRRDATLRALSALGFAVGALAALFALGIHVAVIEANASVPPRLASGHFIWLLGAFVAAIVALVFVFHRRFRAPRR